VPADSLCKQNPGIVPVASQRLLYAELGQRIELVRQIRFADHLIKACCPAGSRYRGLPECVVR